MPEHHTPLIATIAAGLALAYAFGLVAHRLRIQPLAGYVLAGVVVSPSTPGFHADSALAGELAEIGVILLMFGVGLHFSLKDLMAVARFVVPGAIVQIVIVTLLGAELGHLLGWSWTTGLVFGLALSVASTVVMVRAFQERHMLDTERGRFAVAWLVVEDLVTILTLVLLPTVAAMTTGDGVPASRVAFQLVVTLLKVGIFVTVMLLVGRRVIPWLMHYTAHTGSRELFRLAVYALAIGVAFGAAKLFDVSFALGAFFAGVVMGESTLSQQATEEALPLRDAFAVLFFVSVGMLLNPEVFIDAPLALAATVVIIVAAKAALSWAIGRAFKLGNPSALAVAAGRAQIGEFSFILIGLALSLGLVPPLARDLVLGGAIISIVLNPLVFALLVKRMQLESAPFASGEAVVAAPTPAQQPRHDVLIGYGRVGSLVGAALRRSGAELVVIETNEDGLEKARRDAAEVFDGNPADPEILAQANLASARRLFVTIPEP
ncbi:MAG: cation:proton antiporter, partial [Rhodospirillaceae bacterium]